MKKIRVVELFAGVGGFRLGLEQASANFQTVWANQWEPSMQVQFAFDCYERHFGHRPEHVCQDIVTAKGNIPPHDLLVGGFPCQDYSIAKKGARGIEGKKGVLWWEINAILRTHRPRYVLLENVDRLIKSPAWQKGRDFSIILRCFYEAGYIKRSSPPSPFGRWERCTAWSPTAMAWCAVRSIPTATPA